MWMTSKFVEVDRIPIGVRLAPFCGNSSDIFAASNQGNLRTSSSCRTTRARVDPVAIKDIDVLMTMVGGKAWFDQAPSSPRRPTSFIGEAADLPKTCVPPDPGVPYGPRHRRLSSYRMRVRDPQRVADPAPRVRHDVQHPL